MAYIRLRGCKCNPKPTVKSKCKCGAKYSFTVDVGIDPATGKRKQKTVSGFSTKKEAENAARVLEYEHSQGVYVHEKNINFKEFSSEWLKMYSTAGKVKDSTIDVRKMCINRLMSYFAYIPLRDITRKNYQDMLFDLHDRGYSRETINSSQGTGKLIFNKAVELGIIKNNPTQYSIVPVKRETVEELENGDKLPAFLEKEQLRAYLKTLKPKITCQEYAQLFLLAYTGMRIGELCVLKWSDVDFDEGLISITKTLYSVKNNTRKFKLQTPKTKGSQRVITVTQNVLKVLKEIRNDQKEFKMLRMKEYVEHDFIFVNRLKHPGYPEMQKTLEEKMPRFSKLSGLQTKLTPHTFRHTHVSLLAEAGVSLEAIMERLGHQDDKITRMIYMHITKSTKREAARKFDELMDEF
ncbi:MULTISPECIES: site-specific integrase [unclassified Paenibacillus]|uniref:site-specific integrase n=1 Tax=unclassified Paenibacillus TaxID=185978 RepID=UPI0009A882B5|nr:MULTISPECIES: site-specific integrase [unclassified Paenibacillus]SLJ94597.1 Site-specific recombinase XerD [Paenibacillus sp. RU5A]SOC67503.1 Site-specific recombinase XerD [Paenibacillus sp. RU26A]SOC68935.1 Site-specific recombinase XerD [Paenibacillus sp. RU5M]